MTTTDVDRRTEPDGALPFDAFFARMKKEPVYVILGVQGSGTNLLRSILVRAFNFAVIQDQSLIYEAALQVGARASAATVRRQLNALHSRLCPSALTRKTRRRIKSNGSFAGIEDHFDTADIRCGADLARFVYAYSAFSRGTTLMAIKSDDLWQSLDHIDTVLPDRRIILLTRDFRDNLLSITRKEFGPVDPLMAAQYVKERFSRYEAHYRRTLPEHRFHVRYEDLLDSPDTFVQRIGEQFDLIAAGAAPPVVDSRRIRRNNVRKWGSLSNRDLALCEAVLREELHNYGYGTQCDPVAAPGAGTWLVAKSRDTAKRVPQKLRNLARRLNK
jgi:hypothetical protein